MRVGVFDSGYGGLSVLAKCLELMDEEEITFIYYADRDYAPYGEKTIEEVQTLTKRAVQFLIEQEQIDAAVIACNTATSLAIELLRREVEIPIIGIEPAIKPASQHQVNGDQILITATPLMVESERLKKRIAELNLEQRAQRIALPGLVRLAEDESLAWEEKQEQALNYLRQEIPITVSQRCGSVVLGCTHFPFFLSAYQALFSERGLKDVYFADGAEGVARQLSHQLKRPIKKERTQETISSQLIFYESSRLVQGASMQRYQMLLSKARQVS